MTGDISLRVIQCPLPGDIHGFSISDGRLTTVAIDEKATDDEKAAAFLHEMLHIWRGDHCREDITADEIEKECAAELKRIQAYL